MKLGIIGSGKIVHDFLTALPIKGLELAAIATTKRSAQVGQELAEKYHIEKCYDDYLAMLKDENVDTVYVATPPSLHYQMCRDSLEAGKNVICEKPFVFSPDEAIDLKKTADDHGVLIVEAITAVYLPNFQALREDLPKIGPVHVISLNYTQYSSRYDAFLQGEILPAFNPKLGGGALLDLNVYNIHLATALFGAPETVHYYPNMQKGVDTSGILILTYEDKQATLTAAKDSQAFFKNQSLIAGEKGFISFAGSPGALTSYRLDLGEGKDEEKQISVTHRMIPEFQAFVKMMDNHDQLACDRAFQHSLEVIQVLSDAQNS